MDPDPSQLVFAATGRQTDLSSLIPDDWIARSIRISTLDGWKKTEQLGQGAFGEVFRYTTPIPGQPYAAGKHLKKLQLWNLNEKQKEDLIKRVSTFVKELNMLHRVSTDGSAYCVQFLGCYLDQKKIVVFTEYMPNGSIKDHLNDQPLDEATALKYTYQAAQGLKFLHHYREGRTVHRDIKCDNLLLTNERNVKLADFGLAFSLKVDNDSFTMSGPSGFAGTVIFAAPEVLIGEEYGRNADIWSLGCTLVEMLTCQPPHADFWHKYQERAQFLFLEQVQAEPAQQLPYKGRQLVPQASTSVQKLLDCLFIKNKTYRPRSEAIVDVFTSDPSNPANVKINEAKLANLQFVIREKEKQASSK